MNPFRYSKAYRRLVLLLLVICAIGPTVPAFATTIGPVELTAEVNAFTDMAGSGLTVSYTWDDNDTSVGDPDIVQGDLKADASASAADDVITAKARGWYFDSTMLGHATLTLTLTNGSTEEKTLEFTLTETSVSGTVTVKLNNVEQTKAADGKYTFVLAVGESCTVILNTAVPASDTSVTAAAYEEIRLSNLAFYGEAAASAKLTVENDSAMSAYSATTGSFKIVDGTVTGLSVTMPSDYRFIGWVNKDTGVVISTSQTTIQNLTDDATVYPLCAPADYPVLRVGSTDYYYWQDAFAAAAASATESNKVTVTIYGAQGGAATLPAEASSNRLGAYVTDADGDGMVTYVIPTNCRLLLPYSATDAGCWGALTNGTQAATAAPSTYYTLNLAYGAKMICNGEMNVNGQRDEVGQKYTGGPMGSHGLLKLNGTGTQLTISSGGALYCYGFIAGTGKTVVNGTIYEMLQMADFAGGTNSANWSTAAGSDNPELFVLTQYYIQNVESPLRVNYGATQRFVTIVNVSDTPFDQNKVFIGAGGLFVLNDAASYIERAVNCGSSKERVEYVLGGGGITFGSISVEFTMIFEVTLNSQDHVLPLPGLMTVRVTDKASVTMSNALALLPGAEIHVESGASATLTNKLFIFDKSDWKSTYFYQAGATKLLTPPYYTIARGTKIPDAAYNEAGKSGLLEVNGTLTISGEGALYTTNGGTNTDKVLRGTGKIVNSGKTSFTTSYSNKVTDTTSNVLYVGFAKDTYKISFLNYKSLLTNTVKVVPSHANLAGKTGMQNLSTGTYYGIIIDGVNYWYTGSVVISEATCSQTGVTRYHCGGYNKDDTSTYIEVVTPATGEHSWNGCVCTVCGILKFYATNINLGNDLDLLFAIPVAAFQNNPKLGNIDLNSCKVVFEYADSDGNPASKTIEYSASAWPKRAIDGDGHSATGTTYFVFTFGDFAAKQMCDEVTVTIYNGDKAISIPLTTSIRGYALKALKSAQAQIITLDPEDDGTATDSAKANRLQELRYMRTMIVDMLNYGTACQIALDYPNAEPDELELANYGLTDEQKEYASTPLVLQAGAEPDSKLWAASELVTTSNIVYKIALNPDALTNATSVEYAFTGHKGNNVATAVAVSNLNSETIDGTTYRYLRIPSLVVADAQCEITVKINYQDGSIKTFTESIEAYVNRMNQKTADGVYREFLEFAMVAKQYLQCKYKNMEGA